MACGGTGGHIFPAFSVAEELKRRDPSIEIVYVCGKMDIENAIFKIVAGQKVFSVEGAGFRGFGSLLNPAFLLKLTTGLWQSFRILMKEKPDLVAGFGGHFSFSMTFIASILRVPTLIHEQNVVPGKANKVLAHFVDAVALSFEETRGKLGLKKHFRVTGNPIRSAIERECREEALPYFGFTKDRTTLLVLGGSQGAESINVLFLEALSFIPPSLKRQIQVLHLCGKMKIDFVEEAFRQAGVLGKAYSFFDRMDLVYGVTDFALGRAGATFLEEIRVKNIPAVLIPFPLSDGHQRENAKVFCRNHDSVYKEQKDLTGEKLAEALIEFLNKITDKKNIKPVRGTDADREPLNSRVLLADYMLETANIR
ncbi:MAG: hypothetical protein AUJ72_00530 [Candidatus Omnitrophica bacterium CG1_02_46_14]|nr:MAG: hypothetical protein AUJ72_00530 [Candidatus Omnitrophica bacterium CG1_02_46_14]